MPTSQADTCECNHELATPLSNANMGGNVNCVYATQLGVSQNVFLVSILHPTEDNLTLTYQYTTSLVSFRHTEVG